MCFIWIFTAKLYSSLLLFSESESSSLHSQKKICLAGPFWMWSLWDVVLVFLCFFHIQRYNMKEMGIGENVIRTETYIQRYLTMTSKKSSKKKKKWDENCLLSRAVKRDVVLLWRRRPHWHLTVVLLCYPLTMTWLPPKKGKKDEKEGLSMCATAALLHGLIVILLLLCCHTLFMGPPSRMWRKSNHWLTCEASKTFKKSQKSKEIFDIWTFKKLLKWAWSKISKQPSNWGNFLSFFIISCKKWKENSMKAW